MFQLNHPLCCRGGREGAARVWWRMEGGDAYGGQGPALGVYWEVLGVSPGWVLGIPALCLGKDSLGPEEAWFVYLNSKHHGFLWENLAVKLWSRDFPAFLSSLFP